MIFMVVVFHVTWCSGFMLNSLPDFFVKVSTKSGPIQQARKETSNDARRSFCRNMLSKDSRNNRSNGSTTFSSTSGESRHTTIGKKTLDGARKKNRQNSLKQNHQITTRNKNNIRSLFRQAKEMERTGQWLRACKQLEEILELDPHDSYTHLALARLQSRRERGSLCATSDKSKHANVGKMESDITPLGIVRSKPFSKARQAFYNGINNCPDSIHIWQAWALHEESVGNICYARSLFQKALEIDDTNPYVCHGYGLLEHRCGNFDAAMNLWQRPLKSGEREKITAALVCSIGKLMVARGQLYEAKNIFMEKVQLMNSQREAAEVYLAAAWLEEKHFLNVPRAEELLNLALRVSPENSRALVSLARLAGRKVDSENLSFNHDSSYSTIEKFTECDVERRRNEAVKERLKAACSKIMASHDTEKKREQSDVADGRLFNAWAKLEVKDMKYDSARKILIQGMEMFPHDHSVSHHDVRNHILFYNMNML
jgi:tetratricopeptide (TPR) repeat protein